MATFAIQPREFKRETVNRIAVRDQGGKEGVVEEKRVSMRTQDPAGNWSAWEDKANEFWYGNIICARQGESEFVPVMTDDVLTIVKS